MSSGTVYSYLVDNNDRIVAVSSNWSRFAKDNHAHFLGAGQLIGRPLFKHLADKETKFLYKSLLSKCRGKPGTNIRFKFRCDSPELRRFMEMHMNHKGSGLVEFTSTILRKEKRTRVEFMDPSIPRSQNSIQVCSWCKCLGIDGQWMEVEEAINGSDLFDSYPLPQINHCTCPDCYLGIMQSMDTFPTSSGDLGQG